MKSLMKSALGVVLCSVVVSGSAFAGRPPVEGACLVAKASTSSENTSQHYVRVRVCVNYINDETGETWPASGVHIFDATTNALLCITDVNGCCDFELVYGSSFRAVEPQYGEQQYASEPIYTDKTEILGWKAPGK